MRMGQKTPVPYRSGGFALLQSYVILYLEVVVIGAQIHDTLYQTNDSGDVSPAKQQIQNTHTGFAQIELVNAKAAQQDRQDAGGDLALYRPAGIDAVIVAGLYKDLYRLTRLTGLTVCALLLILGCNLRRGYCLAAIFTFCCARCQRSAALGTKIFCNNNFPPIS